MDSVWLCHRTDRFQYRLGIRIGGGPLTYIGEALSAALGIFGIGVYFAGKVTEFKKEIRNFLVEEQNRQPDDNSTD